MVALTGELGEPPERVLDLWRLDELRGIAVDGDAIVLGALTTYTEIRRSALCREHLPALVEAAATIGAAQIQNRGTLGGNIANASPAGDTLPVLLALDASFVCGSARGERTVPSDAFWTGLPADGACARMSSWSGCGCRSRPVARPGSARSAPGGPSRSARSCSPSATSRPARRRPGPRSGSPSGPSRRRRSGRPPRRPPWKAVRRRRRPPIAPSKRSPRELHPIDDVRSTAEYRRLVAARVLHRLIREAGGW